MYPQDEKAQDAGPDGVYPEETQDEKAQDAGPR